MLTLDVARTATPPRATGLEGAGGTTSMDAHQFSAVYEREHAAITAYVSRRLPPSAVDDVVAEVFVGLWEGRGRVPSVGEVRAWLFGIARHRVASAQREHWAHQGRMRAWAAVLAGVPVVAPDAAIAVLDADQARRVHAALGYRDAEVLQLAGWEGLTTTEIAVVLGCSDEAARQRLSRARRRLTALVEADERGLR